jgi:hypothetical protein
MNAREIAQVRANIIGEPVMVVTCCRSGVEFVYEGDPMDLRPEYRIIDTVEPTR